VSDPDAGWLTVDIPGGVHVLPLEDLIVHSESRHCPCAPRVSLVDGPCEVVHKHSRPLVAGVPAPMCQQSLVQYVRNLVVHQAMDGRE
jgi:hypothetical protein